MTPFDSAPRAWLRAGSRGYRLAACAVTLGVLTFVYRYLSFEEFPNDHYMHLAIAQQITRGGLGVRDYVELGIPLMTMLSAWSQLGLGETLRSEVITDSQTQQEMLDDYPRIGAHVRRHYHEAERFAISSDKSFVVWVEHERPACARLE